MGWHNRITLEQFQRIKAVIQEKGGLYKSVHALDRAVATACGIGYTTACHARLSEDYEAYCKRTKGKYWYASEEDKAPKNLPYLRLNNRHDTDDSVQTLNINGAEYRIRLTLEPIGG